MKPNQYLLDHLKGIEDMISIHSKLTMKKKYLVYRDGYLYTGTDEFKDVLELCAHPNDLYTYKLNTK